MQGDVKRLLKPVMTTREFAELMAHLNPPNEGQPEWSTRRARRWLKRRGLIPKKRTSGHHRVTLEHLERVLPDLAGDVRVMLARGR